MGKEVCQAVQRGPDGTPAGHHLGLWRGSDTSHVVPQLNPYNAVGWGVTWQRNKVAVHLGDAKHHDTWIALCSVQPRKNAPPFMARVVRCISLCLERGSQVFRLTRNSETDGKQSWPAPEACAYSWRHMS